MKRVTLLILILLFVPIVPIASYANINVTISDGTTTKNSLAGFNLSIFTTAGANQKLVMLTCSTPPCARFFPSGGTTAGTGDTFKIQDISSTNLARVEKVDCTVDANKVCTTGAQTLTLRGIKIFALTSVARTFTLTYATQPGDFGTVNSSSGNYAGTAKLTGQFRLDTIAPIDGLSGSIPTQCNNGVDNPCAKLATRINLLTLNGAGSTADLTATIPCVSGSNSPCGSGGFWSPGLLAGTQFLSTDTGSVGCGTTCQPFWQSTLTGVFNTVNQVFALANSAATGIAPDTPQGLVDLAIALAEPGIDVWVGSCGGVQTGALPYLVTGLPPFGNTGRNQSDSATFPMKFSLQKGQLVPLVPGIGGFPNFESINDPSESILPRGDRLRNDACSMSWVPSPSSRPTFGGKNGISQLTLNFTDFVIGPADSGNPLLGILNFSDCTACFRVEIQLVDSNGLPQDTLIVYLGADASNFFKKNYAAYAAPGPTSLVLLSDPGLRVDASATANEFPQPCCISFAEAQKSSDYGKLFVRAITVVIDPGLDLSLNLTGNHLVTNLEAVVNGNSSNASMLTVGNFQPSCDWPPADGLKIYIYRVDQTGTFFTQNALNPTVDSSCNLTASVNVAGFGTGTYEAIVEAFSLATDPLNEFVGGIALPNPGEMVLK